MIESWDDLPFWKTGEWQVIQERLDELDPESYCPRRELLFSALDACPLHTARACIMGHDPYPDRECATGMAFSIPRGVGLTPTLVNILGEYQSDLGYDVLPDHGDLSSWSAQGVLLWNAIPTCLVGKPGSHHDWVEWDLLTQQIIEALSDRCIIFGLLGTWAREYLKYIDLEANEVILTAHPSPRAQNMAKTTATFKGSRFFSTMNAKLIELKQEPIDWRL